MKKAALFIDELRQDLKGFFYWCLVFTLFRLAFIFAFKEQLGGTEAATIGQALLLGLRLSLKTCGFIMLGSALFASLPQIFCSHWPVRRVRLAWNCFWLLFFSAAFMARLPYYEIFHSAFDMMVINGLYDDKGAILATAVEEYQLFPRTGGALLIAALLSYVYWRLVVRYEAAHHFYSKTKTALAFFSLPVFWIFCRYGAAFDYAHNVNWQNAARLPSHLLNEAILDDGQALYRVYYIKKDMDKAAKLELSPEQLEKYIAAAGGSSVGVSLDDRFLKAVTSPKISKKPQDVVLILGEAFGVWPFLERFQGLKLVTQTKALAESPQGASLGTMLADGSSTIFAVNALLTGLPGAGVYSNHQADSYKEKYAAGAAAIMKRLGYRPVFWYGGFPEWQNLEKFALAQGFEEFHSANEMTQTGGNSWGCPDKELFRHVTDYMKKEKEKTFHLILTITNHSPYTLDVDKEGFPREEVRAKLTEDIPKKEKTLTQLGHIWYADMTMGQFVKEAEALRPDTLFIITGDHSERFDFAKEEDIRTRSLIPCIFYGQGVKKAWFDDKSYGSQMQLPGTLAELLGPPGFTYCAYYPSLFARPAFVFNHNLYASPTELRKLDLQTGTEAEKVKALRKVAAWRVVKGDKAE